MPSLTIIANSVFKPKLHEHTITKIVTNIVIAISKLCLSIKYIVNASIAKAITNETKYPETVSATFAIGGFIFDVSTTSLTNSGTTTSFSIFQL